MVSFKELLQTHNSLKERLQLIPKARGISYREEVIDTRLVGKPRFDSPKYNWPSQEFASLRDHLQNIWDYFDSRSFWFDDELKELLLYDSRRLSKKSVVFLLERNVWETDEVYGDYLIETNDAATKISYFRFGQKFKTFSFPLMGEVARKEWILQDAVRQIQFQFSFLWDRLEMELLTCRDESHNKPIAIALTDDLLYQQHQISVKLSKVSKEAVLLMLGRLEELWLLKTLNLKKIDRNEKLLPLAQRNNVISNDNRKLFWKIRRNYNLLKHSTEYNVDSCDIESLIKQFGHYINRAKNNS